MAELTIIALSLLVFVMLMRYEKLSKDIEQYQLETLETTLRAIRYKKENERLKHKLRLLNDDEVKE